MKQYRRWLAFAAAWVLLLAWLRHHNEWSWALDCAFVSGLATAWVLTWVPFFSGRAKVRT